MTDRRARIRTGMVIIFSHGRKIKYMNALAEPEHERQSPMKNLEVSFSLLDLKFKCKNLFLMWGKHLGARI